MKKESKFLKKNWDILWAYLPLIIGAILVGILILLKTNWGGVIGSIVILGIAFLASFIFLVIAIIRTFKDEKLRTRGRIILIGILLVLVIVSRVYSFSS